MSRSSERSEERSGIRLACLRHAASVHPEPGSNSLKVFYLVYYPRKVFSIQIINLPFGRSGSPPKADQPLAENSLKVFYLAYYPREVFFQKLLIFEPGFNPGKYFRYPCPGFIPGRNWRLLAPKFLIVYSPKFYRLLKCFLSSRKIIPE